jgi:hypothetical protein
MHAAATGEPKPLDPYGWWGEPHEDTKAKLSEIIKNIHSIEGPSPPEGDCWPRNVGNFTSGELQS